MIITVTLNPATDKIYYIEGFTEGGTNRAVGSRSYPAGKGVNVSRVLLSYGVESLAMGICGIGFAEKLANYGVESDFVTVRDESRTNVKIADVESGLTTEINGEGMTISQAALGAFRSRLFTKVDKGDIVVFSGSIAPGMPEDIYYELIKKCKELGAYVILDSSGAALERGIEAKPHMIKPNLDELEYLAKVRPETKTEIITVANMLLEEGVQTVLVSMGAEGAALISHASEPIFAPAPKIDPGCTVGAGDAMVAAYIIGRLKRLPPEEILKSAVEAGSSVATTGLFFSN